LIMRVARLASVAVAILVGLTGSQEIFAGAADPSVPAPAHPSAPADAPETSLAAEIAAEKKALAIERANLDAQEQRLRALEERLLNSQRAAGTPQEQTPASTQPDSTSPPELVEKVGAAPPPPPRPQEVAALADQGGGVITRRSQVTVEGDFEYARADRNRFIFRGIEVPQSVLVGVFDINESRQDLVTAAVVSRVGITNRLEINARLPYVYRTDSSVLSPVSGANSGTGTQDYSVDDFHVGDVEFGLRYQVTDGGNGSPFLIAGLQALAPTGSNPFTVPRDALGNATQSATGAGFWGISPTLTALLPSDPAVLFGSIGYTYNFGRGFNTNIGDTTIEYVRPGGEPNFNIGIGIALNPRTSVSFAYAQTMSFGTKTRARTLDESQTPAVLSGPIETTSRNLQLGRLIVGISYRLNRRATFNWDVEVGTTQDAADVRTTFRVPVTYGPQ
jgi:hypothetical protein